jgi:hypothetical protein
MGLAILDDDALPTPDLSGESTPASAGLIFEGT